MRTSGWCGIALLFFASAVVADDLGAAREMVRLMAADESVAVGARLGFRKLRLSNRMTAHQNAVCDRSVRTDMFTDGLAEVASKELSPQEIRAASEFFGTVPGKKVTRPSSLRTSIRLSTTSRRHRLAGNC